MILLWDVFDASCFNIVVLYRRAQDGVYSYRAIAWQPSTTFWYANNICSFVIAVGCALTCYYLINRDFVFDRTVSWLEWILFCGGSLKATDRWTLCKYLILDNSWGDSFLSFTEAGVCDSPISHFIHYLTAPFCSWLKFIAWRLLAQQLQNLIAFTFCPSLAVDTTTSCFWAGFYCFQCKFSAGDMLL